MSARTTPQAHRDVTFPSIPTITQLILKWISLHVHIQTVQMTIRMEARLTVGIMSLSLSLRVLSNPAWVAMQAEPSLPRVALPRYLSLTSLIVVVIVQAPEMCLQGEGPFQFSSRVLSHWQTVCLHATQLTTAMDTISSYPHRLSPNSQIIIVSMLRRRTECGWEWIRIMNQTMIHSSHSAHPCLKSVIVIHPPPPHHQTLFQSMSQTVLNLQLILLHVEATAHPVELFRLHSGTAHYSTLRLQINRLSFVWWTVFSTP